MAVTESDLDTKVRDCAGNELSMRYGSWNVTDF